MQLPEEKIPNIGTLNFNPDKLFTVEAK